MRDRSAIQRAPGPRAAAAYSRALVHHWCKCGRWKPFGSTGPLNVRGLGGPGVGGPPSWWARVGEKYPGMGAGEAYLVCDHGLTLPSEILRNRDSAFSAGPFLLHDIGLNAEQNPYGVSRDSRAARRIATTVRRNGNFRRRRQSTRADFFAATVVLYRALRLPNELECGFAVTINPPFGTSMLLRADLVKMW